MREMSEQQTQASVDDVRETIRVVIDPEIGISVVDLGLVYDIAIEEEVCKITYTLTAMGCPVGPMLEQQFRTLATALPGIEEVECTMTFEPAWTPEKMSDEARAALGMF